MATKLPVPFTPAQLRPRHDGWTAERQIAFVKALGRDRLRRGSVPARGECRSANSF